jgi:transcriptional regulator with XRE-family HTH domain
MNTNFENILKEYQPDLYEQQFSKQNELSTDILELRLINDLSVEEISRYLNLSVNEYLDFEFGEMNKNIDQYYDIIANMKNIIRKIDTDTSIFKFDLYKHRRPFLETQNLKGNVASFTFSEVEKENKDVKISIFLTKNERQMVFSITDDIKALPEVFNKRFKNRNFKTKKEVQICLN